MQNLILEGLQQKLQKSCSRCNKNTWHVELSYMSQPPQYLLLFVNRFRYINNNVTKDRCSIPMDTTVRLGPLKISLRATIDHHGPSIHSGHYAASINCCKNILLQRSRVEEQAPKPVVGWCVSSWWPSFPSRISVLSSISSFLLYFDICNHICLDTSHHFFAFSLLLEYSLFFVLSITVYVIGSGGLRYS